MYQVMKKHHTLNLKSKGEPVAADLQITGNFDRTSQQWKGNLSQVSLNSPIGDFKVNQTVPVTYDNKKNPSHHRVTLLG